MGLKLQKTHLVTLWVSLHSDTPFDYKYISVSPFLGLKFGSKICQVCSAKRAAGSPELRLSFMAPLS